MEALSATPAAAARFGRIGRSVPDHRLVTRVRAGDERAFEAIFDRYHRPLLAFCRHMLGSREEAEDALQHVFVSAHRHLVARDEVIELRPWLYAIARNRCLSVLRARREAVALDDVPEPSVDGLSVAAEVEQRQDLKEILGDLRRLPDDQRAALVLSELGALSHDEIASVLGVRRDKVKALVFQAREALAAWRAARDTDCRAIREQLANLTGGALRRGPLRKHLETCEGCRDFRSEVRRQREAMAMILPVVPTIALKAKVVGAITAGSAAAPLGAGAGVAGTALTAGTAATTGASAIGGSIVAKTLVIAAVAGTAGGGYAVVDSTTGPESLTRPATTVPLDEKVRSEPARSTAAPAPAAPAAGQTGKAKPGKPGDRGRGSTVPAAKTKGKGKADLATPGRPGVPPIAANAPGQTKAKGKPAAPERKPDSAGRPESKPARPLTPPGRSKPSAETGGSAKADKPTKSERAPPQPVVPVAPSTSTNAAAPSAASARPEDAGKPDKAPEAADPDLTG